MTDERPPGEPGPARRSFVGQGVRSWWEKGVAWHLAALAVLLVGLIPLMRVDTSFTSDEGAYGLQVEALEQGGWALEPPSSQFDGALRFPPWDGAVVPAGIIPYDRHPLYPVLLRVASNLTGGIDGALLATGLLGVLAAAAGAWFLGRELRPGSERLAFWLAALSPVALHGYILWAHTATAALAVWAAVLLLKAIRARSTTAWILCSACLVAGLLLRSESLLLAASVVVGVGAAGVALRRRDLIVGGGAIGLAVAVAVLVERRVIAGISDAERQMLHARGSGPGVGDADLGYVAARVEGFQRSMLDGAIFSDRAAAVAQLSALLLVAAGVLAARQAAWRPAAACAVAGGVLLVLRSTAYTGDPIPGLVVAWPVALAALVGAVAVARNGDSATRVLLVSVSGAFLAVLATQYADGGGAWAGRFFTMLVPILAVLAALSWSPTWRVERRVWASGLVAISLLAAASAVHYVRARRETYQDISETVIAQDADLAATIIPFIPRSLWRDDQAWMLASANQLDDALDLAHAAGVDPVVVVVPDGWPVATPGWRVEKIDVVAPTNLNVAVYRFTAR